MGYIIWRRRNISGTHCKVDAQEAESDRGGLQCFFDWNFLHLCWLDCGWDWPIGSDDVKLSSNWCAHHHRQQWWWPQFGFRLDSEILIETGCITTVITSLNTETRWNFLAWFAGWPVETMTSSQTGSGARISINGGDGLAASFETTHQEPRFTQMLVL